jgi:hypothetical protein
MSDKGAVYTAFPFCACRWAPGCTAAGASYLYSEGAGPSRKGNGNLVTLAAVEQKRAGYTTAYTMQGEVTRITTRGARV